MSVMKVPTGMNFVFKDEILGVEQLTVDGQMTGTGMLITNCDLLVGLENIADTIECACRVTPPTPPTGDHFFIESFWDDEVIANNNQDIGILFAYAARVAPILVVDIDGRQL